MGMRRDIPIEMGVFRVDVEGQNGALFGKEFLRVVHGCFRQGRHRRGKRIENFIGSRMRPVRHQVFHNGKTLQGRFHPETGQVLMQFLIHYYKYYKSVFITDLNSMQIYSYFLKLQ